MAKSKFHKRKPGLFKIVFEIKRMTIPKSKCFWADKGDAIQIIQEKQHATEHAKGKDNIWKTK